MTEVAIVGGGLVGALAAILLANRGFNVSVYEGRGDSRKEPASRTRSINLALSERGIAALKAAGVMDTISKAMIPMKGRMLHANNGQLTSVPYGVQGQAINSIDRKLINDTLLTKAENLPNVRLFFNHEVIQADLDKGTLVFSKEDGALETVKADFILGADGVYSRVRSFLMRKTRMTFEQQYIDHAWREVTIPPLKTGEFAMDPNHLHIWPRHEYMMIALPNKDKTFTGTLFMPWSIFETLKTPEDVTAFFEREFPDALKMIGKEKLLKDFFNNPLGSLVSVKCKPYHYKHRALIVGDAAHAMVPFYGQGMNCGFEDILVLDGILEKHLLGTKASTKIMQSVLAEYTATRHADAVAICDLAMYNYIEMRSGVTTLKYKARKWIEGVLHYLFPSLVIPLYTMVSFTRIPYSEAYQRWKTQSKFLEGSAICIGMATVGITSLYLLRRFGIRSISFLLDQGKVLIN